MTIKVLLQDSPWGDFKEPKPQLLVQYLVHYPARRDAYEKSAIFRPLLSISRRVPTSHGGRLTRRRRLVDLAKPKTNWQVIKNRVVYNCKGYSWYSPKRRMLHFCVYWPSVYWTEQFLKDSTLSVTLPAVSHRVEELSRPKRFYSDYYSNFRKSAIWPVSRPALQYRASCRLRELATPRVRNNIWSINMCQVSKVSKAAQMAVPSPRIIRLAKPRTPATLLDEWNPMPKPKPYVSDYNRLLHLATPKALPDKCVPDRDPRWSIPDVTKKAVASPRLLSLAQPKVRKDLNTSRDPYQVSPASLMAHATPRLTELATPKSITRKV
ncbi:testicular haploid expressed gene protein isoform X1 [Sorex araneus]|uniref:testicular haploid expressed gene protein isoform X1 n=1 Tax=Sorex araneus TaxID=42254 RepID=UPI0024335259|nr:testicular haploid expressed gene protein isoform X1 [Sorex araneus]